MNFMLQAILAIREKLAVYTQGFGTASECPTLCDILSHIRWEVQYTLCWAYLDGKHLQREIASLHW